MIRILLLTFMLVAAPFTAHANPNGMCNNAAPEAADACRAQELYCKTERVLNSSYGVALGVIVAFVGFYSYIMSGSIGGIIMMLIGALIPAGPTVYRAFLIGTEDLIGQPMGLRGVSHPVCAEFTLEDEQNQVMGYTIIR